MKYVFFTTDFYPFPIAKHLQGEGNDVTIALINHMTDLRVPEIDDEEKPADRKERMSTFDGMIDKKSLKEAMEMLSRVKDKDRADYFIFFDFNNMFHIAEDCLKMGFTNGLFPTEYYYKMEREREMARDFVKENYTKLKVAESHDFQTVDEGIDFLLENDGIFVLKSNGNCGKTVVPKTEDEDVAREQVIETLHENRKDYEEGGFLLEQKIQNALEVTPVLVCYDGVPIYSVAEFENKEYGAGNIGSQKGGNQVLSVRTELNCKLNKIAFPQAVLELAAQQPGMSIFDAGLLWNGTHFYFTEFCAMRFGWDGVFSEMVMGDNGKPFVGYYFEQIVKGKSPIRKDYGVSVRLFNYEGDLEDTTDPQGGEVITWDKSIENNLFLYGVKMEKNKVVDTAHRDFIAVVTGADNDMEKAVKSCYDRIGKFHFEKLYFRPCFDFLSKDYRNSIPNRLSAIKRFL